MPEATGARTAEKSDSDKAAGVIWQKTLAGPVACEGIGLHSGKKISMRILPGNENTGILFKRTDLNGDAALIPAQPEAVVDTRLCTVLGNLHGSTVATVEHLMAALWAKDIDNAVIEIDGPEIPAMDGSSAPFLFLLDCAGTKSQREPRQFITLNEMIRVEDGDKWIEITPADTLQIDFNIAFNAAAIAEQTYSFGGTGIHFRHELARARTFGFLKDVETLRSQGLALGGSLENAVVVDGAQILNPDGLRFKDEFVRHKVLDLIGDFYLAGRPVLAHIKASKAGHALNNRALREICRRAVIV